MRKIILTRALVLHDGKYLLLKRAKDDFLSENVGKWECPGGRVEKGESPEHCALREFKAETGLEGRVVKELPFLHMRTDKIDSHCYVYLMEIDSEDVKLSDEHSEHAWVEAREVKNYELVQFASLLLEYFNNEELYLG